MKAILRGQLPASAVSSSPALRSASGVRVHVLFVSCSNACRSQMAEAFANYHGSDVVRAESAGVRPAPRLSQTALNVMREKGIDIVGRAPKDLERFNLERFDLLVNLSGLVLPQTGSAPVLNLSIPDPVGRGDQFFREVRDRIERHVARLLRDLRAACFRQGRSSPVRNAAFSRPAATPC